MADYGDAEFFTGFGSARGNGKARKSGRGDELSTVHETKLAAAKATGALEWHRVGLKSEEEFGL
jgi:hypothetical protein